MPECYLRQGTCNAESFPELQPRATLMRCLTFCRSSTIIIVQNDTESSSKVSGLCAGYLGLDAILRTIIQMTNKKLDKYIIYLNQHLSPNSQLTIYPHSRLPWRWPSAETPGRAGAAGGPCRRTARGSLDVARTLAWCGPWGKRETGVKEYCENRTFETVYFVFEVIRIHDLDLTNPYPLCLIIKTGKQVSNIRTDGAYLYSFFFINKY